MHMSKDILEKKTQIGTLHQIDIHPCYFMTMWINAIASLTLHNHLDLQCI